MYERVQHITLKSIANNPDITEGMSREAIDAAIKRHADFEMLYDKPYEDRKTVRVSGPFTVESLSPHRSLAGFSTGESASVQAAADDVDAPTFEQTILDNLRSAGVQNGRRAERLMFDVVEPYAGVYIQAVGERPEASRCVHRAAVRHGVTEVRQGRRARSDQGDRPRPPVHPRLRLRPAGAQRLRRRAGTAFDVAGERSLGRIPVLLVRMNSDLLMGEELKKTGAGNLFTVFGEPDIVIKVEGDLGAEQVVVELLGVDVFDPTTGEVRSGGTDQVALWMIDTDYDGDSFFVRHCYFTGGQDPYARLKKALKADIDEDAWATLYQTTSRPFPMPATGRVAVKVINDYGDEVVKIYDVASGER